jgi:hypothetical protein
LIGVLASDGQRLVAREFFELFKTHWEFYASDRDYDVLLCSQNNIPRTKAKLIISFVCDINQFNHGQGIRVRNEYRKGSARGAGFEFPIYGNVFSLEGSGKALLWLKGSTETVGLETHTTGGKRIYLGFDFFKEIAFLLSQGQPKENSQIPAIEIHISVLRNLIISAGVAVVEVPPVPAGYDFIACLTHDVDFAGIRSHRFDHTMFGFLFRASVGSILGFLKGKLSFEKLMRNWKAVLSLPLVYAGFLKDFWYQIDKYIEVEKETKSTFFLIPFKNRPGDNIPKDSVKRRATNYDVSDIREVARTLMGQGFEIGVHGIDAWHNIEKSQQELNRIIEFCQGPEIGIRIHWLCFNNDSYRILEESGFTYDSTFGYNDAVGYRAGTAQVFKPLKAKRLLEFPLHIQDSTLFFPRRMNLSEERALELCEILIKNAKSFGGVLTILWHDRSFAPERLWGDFYLNLLNEIKKYKVWFATAGEIVSWFRRRRGIMFENVSIGDNRINLSVKYDSHGSTHAKEPFAFVRIYHPKLRNSNKQNPLFSSSGFIDIALKGETSFEINLDSINT